MPHLCSEKPGALFTRVGASQKTVALLKSLAIETSHLRSVAPQVRGPAPQDAGGALAQRDAPAAELDRYRRTHRAALPRSARADGLHLRPRQRGLHGRAVRFAEEKPFSDLAAGPTITSAAPRNTCASCARVTSSRIIFRTRRPGY